jgi:hypothetical protein
VDHAADKKAMYGGYDGCLRQVKSGPKTKEERKEGKEERKDGEGAQRKYTERGVGRSIVYEREGEGGYVCQYEAVPAESGSHPTRRR